MKARAWISAGLLALGVACSGGHSNTTGFNEPASNGAGGNSNSNSNSNNNTGDDGGGSATSSGGNGNAGTSGGGDDSSTPPDSSTGVSTTAVNDGGNGAGLVYDGSAADDDLGPPITLTMSPFTVTAANPEVYKCQWFGNPFGHDVDIVKMVGHMTAGSHHFFLFNMGPLTGQTNAAPLGDCPNGGLEQHPFPFLSQQPDWTVTYPKANLGYPIPSGNGLMMNVHFLNTTGGNVTPTVSITIYPAKAGVVTTRVGTLFLNNVNLKVPAGVSQSNPVAVSETLAPILDEDYTIFTNWSHMHKYALDFSASTGGSAFYDNKVWDEPPIQTSMENSKLPMSIKSGTQLTWTCMYYNPTSSSMTFGESATANDMCIYIAQYYPADGNPITNPNYPDLINPSGSL